MAALGPLWAALGLSWASFEPSGPRNSSFSSFELSEPLGGHFGPPGGPWRSQAAPGPLRGHPGAAPEAPWGRSWRLLGLSGTPVGPLGRRLGRSWGLLGLSWAALGASWASFGGSWAALGREKRCFTKPCKNHGFCMVSGPPGALLAPPGALLGGTGRPLGPSWRLLGVSWAVLSGLGRQEARPEAVLGVRRPAASRRDPRKSCSAKSKSREAVQT